MEPESSRTGGYARDAARSGRGRAAVAPRVARRAGPAKRSRVVRRVLLALCVLAMVAAVSWLARSSGAPFVAGGRGGELAAAMTVSGQAVLVSESPAQALSAPRPELDPGPTVSAKLDTSATRAADPSLPDGSLPRATDEPPEPPRARASWRIRHEGHFPIKGGVLHAPLSFVPEADGSYDLIVHFHGNTWAVRESVEQAGISAMVAIVNLGIGSAVYREAYEATGTWEALLEQIDRGVQNRGVPHPKLRRVALSAWSAGYGAVGSILTFRSGKDPLDAVLMEDGIHASWKEEDPTKLKPQVLRIFAAAAREAAAGKILFTMTHSAIEPPTYAGTAAAASYLLREVGATPNTGALFEMPSRIALACCEHAVNPRLEKRLIPTSDTRVGQLHIRGYTGETKEHHMAHLLQMAATVLPELAERWRHSTEPLRSKIAL